jgi:hypothetical protein
MRRIAGLILSFMFLMMAAAAANAQGKPPGDGADACTLISRAEIEEIMGIKLSDGEKTSNLQKKGILSTCDYSTAEGGQVSMLIRQTSVKYLPGSEKAEFEKTGMKLRYAQGLGDTAFFADMAGTGTGLNIFRGDHDFVLITAMGIGPLEKVSPNMVKLAHILLDRWK